MFKEKVHIQQQRLFIPYVILCITLAIFLLTLFSKSILGHRYYLHLSESNRTKEIKQIAPRGVFFDRDGMAMVSNLKSEKYGFVRHYTSPKATAHLLGYLSLPDQINLHDYSCGAPPLSNQFMGRIGLEKYFECLLRGLPGKSIVEINALGKQLRELARQEPIRGKNINLTVSLALQKTAERAFAGRAGAAVATDPQTGEVLLFYSSPSYDPNRLLSQEGLYEELSEREDQPLFNRLSSGLYPPGSVIKPLLALGALEEGIITKETIYEDNGIYKLGGLEFGNWYFLQYGKTEGEVNVVKAIKRSNDIFFYHLGTKMGLSKINQWFGRFGLSERSLNQYFSQSQSLLPTADWKKRTLKEPWFLGDTVNLSIGQGYLLVNPLQLHQALSIIAANGKKCELTFVRGELRPCQKLELMADHLETIQRGMVAACENGGTGWPFFDFKIKGKPLRVACKTGTAEAGGAKATPHAWFTVYAPVENPQIALTVLLENGGEGSSEAAPVAKQILEQFFSLY